MNRSIVCGVDGSPDAQHALAVAAELSRRLDARLVVAHVLEVVGASLAYAPSSAPAGLARPVTTTAGLEAEREAAEALLEQSLARAGIDAAEPRTVHGFPAESLADLADEEDAELVVVGSRGRGAFKAAFLGSVSNSLIGVARCPVLIVPRGAA